MRNRSILLCLIFFLLCVPSYTVFAAMSLVKGELIDDKYFPTFSVQEHYELATKSMESKDWDEALHNCLIIAYHFAETPFYNDALFFSGICFYNLEEYDIANKQFSVYLTQKGNAKHFEEVFEYKFQIAEKFRNGARRHMMGSKRLPKWFTGRGEALKLYDEIVVSLPNKNLAIQSLYSKGLLLQAKRDYREAIECLQVLVRRFPKHPLAAEGYLQISKIYVEQSQIEAQNPDILALAQINLRRFRKVFPSEDRLQEVEQDLIVMKESFANSLYETGRFYERKKKPHAAVIYYNDAIRRYPETGSANRSKERLAQLKSKGIDVQIQIVQKAKNNAAKILS